MSRNTDTFAIGIVYADGNPFDLHTGLDPVTAAATLTMEQARHPGKCPHVFCYDADDEERGYFDVDRLLEDEDGPFDV